MIVLGMLKTLFLKRSSDLNSLKDSNTWLRQRLWNTHSLTFSNLVSLKESETGLHIKQSNFSSFKDLKVYFPKGN